MIAIDHHHAHSDDDRRREPASRSHAPAAPCTPKPKQELKRPEKSPRETQIVATSPNAKQQARRLPIRTASARE